MARQASHNELHRRLPEFAPADRRLGPRHDGWPNALRCGARTVRMLTVYFLLAAGQPTLARCSTQDAATVEAAVSQATGIPYRVGFSNVGFPSRWHGKVFIQAWLIATTCLAMPNTRVQRKAACEVDGMAAYVWWFDAVRVCFRARALPVIPHANQRVLRCTAQRSARVDVPPFFATAEGRCEA